MRLGDRQMLSGTGDGGSLFVVHSMLVPAAIKNKVRLLVNGMQKRKKKSNLRATCVLKSRVVNGRRLFVQVLSSKMNAKTFNNKSTTYPSTQFINFCRQHGDVLVVLLNFPKKRSNLGLVVSRLFFQNLVPGFK